MNLHRSFGLLLGLALPLLLSAEPPLVETTPPPDLEAELIGAVLRGDAAGVAQALDRGADPDAESHTTLIMGSRTTPVLILAIRDRHREIVDLLIDAGADTAANAYARAILSGEKQPLFLFLVRTGDLAFIRELIPRLEIDPEAFSRGLLAAAYLEDPAIFRYLLTLAEDHMRLPKAPSQ